MDMSIDDDPEIGTSHEAKMSSDDPLPLMTALLLGKTPERGIMGLAGGLAGGHSSTPYQYGAPDEVQELVRRYKKLSAAKQLEFRAEISAYERRV